MSISFSCPNCRTGYRLPDSMVGESGLRVRCTRCKSVFEVSGGKGGAPEPRSRDLGASGAGSGGTAPRRSAPPGPRPEAPRGHRPGDSGEAARVRASIRERLLTRGDAQPRPDDLPGDGRRPGEVGPRPGEAPPSPADPASPGGGTRTPKREYDLGPLPVDADPRFDPALGDVAFGADEPGVLRDTAAAPWQDGPGSFGIGGRRLPDGPSRLPDGPSPLPIRRPPPPAATGRRAFLAGLLGVAGLAVAGRLSWGAWRRRDWLAFLSGNPFEVEVERQRTLTGRAGPLYVVDGSIRNLSGTPKGFLEVRGRLVGRDGQTLAERVVHAGTVLADPELKGLTRTELNRRVRETVLGDGMANARVEPRQRVPFQIVFVPAPPAGRIVEAEVEVVGAKDVP